MQDRQSHRTRNSTENERTLANCGFVKTVLMLVIIWGHSFDFWTGTWFTENPALENREIGIIATWLNSFHIYAFALVSGYLFAYKVIGGGGTTVMDCSLKIRQKDFLYPMYSQC